MGDYSKGMHWVGHPGSLHPFKDYGSVSVTDDVDPVIQTSMSGARRARVRRGRAPRSWSFSIPDAHADDVAALRTLVTATLPPYVLVTAEAQVSNVLTPEQSTLSDLIQPDGLGLAGAWPLEGGEFSTVTRLNPNAAFGNAANVVIGPAPVPPAWTGRAVTASVWLGSARAAGARVTLQWLDAAGSMIAASVAGNYVTGMDVLRRSTVTGTLPLGAVACRLLIQYAEIITQPQVTWTDHAIPEWSPGNGANRAVVTGLDRDTDLAVPDQYSLRRGDYGVTMTEVGP